MLGQPMAMLIPRSSASSFTGQLPAGATATDLVLTVTQMLRKKGVVDKFVEFTGSGIAALSLPDRATIANMAPEYGATMASSDRRRDPHLSAIHRAQRRSRRARRALRQGEPPVARPGRAAALRRHPVARPRKRRAVARRPGPAAGPRADQDVASRLAPRGQRHPRRQLQRRRRRDRHLVKRGRPRRAGNLGATRPVTTDHGAFDLGHGSVVIAAITSCTNTSNRQC